MHIFGIAFGKPPVPILKIWGSFQSVFSGHFEYFFADAAQVENVIYFSEMLGSGVGPPFFAFVLLAF